MRGNVKQVSKCKYDTTWPYENAVVIAPSFNKNGLLTALFFLSSIVNLLFTELSLSIL